MINKYLSVIQFLFIQLDLVLAGNKNCGRFVPLPSTFNYKILLLSLLSSEKQTLSSKVKKKIWITYFLFIFHECCDLFARKMRELKKYLGGLD
jgi:hypothetical protein